MTITNGSFFVQQRNWLLYGDFGTGKTTSAATFVKAMHAHTGKPGYIFMFDQPGKEQPYLNLGLPCGWQNGGGMFWQDVLTEDQKPLCRVEYFFDMNPAQLRYSQQPSAYEKFQARLTGMQWTDYSLVVLDSLSGYRDSILTLHKYKLNPSDDPKQEVKQNWFSSAAGAIVADILGTLAWAPVPFVTTAHVSRKELRLRDLMFYGVAIPGQLAYDIGRGFSEVYYQFVTQDDKGQIRRYWLTQHNGEFMATSQLGLPMLVEPTIEALWR